MWENLFEEITAETFPNLREKKKQPSPGSTENPKQDQLKEVTPRNIIVKMEKKK